MKQLTLFVALLFFVFALKANEPLTKGKDKFSFAFFTDIHLNNGAERCWDGLNKAIKNAKANKVDFILTGGDNVDIDVLKDDGKTAHELMQKYTGIIEKSGIDYYATLGNHDRFWELVKKIHSTTKAFLRNTLTKVIIHSTTKDGILLY